VLAAVLLIGLVALLYAPVRTYDFVAFDDPQYVSENPHVGGGLDGADVAWAFTHQHAGYWIPLVWLSYMLDVEIWGGGPGGFHVTNVVLHAANVVLLFALLFRLTGRAGAAFVVAALFAVHPLHVESVAWITERKDVLSTLFLLLTLWLYVGYVRSRTPIRYAAMTASFALGLLAKPMLVTVPFVMLLLDFWPLRRAPTSAERPTRAAGAPMPWRALVDEKLPLFALALAAAVIAFVTQRAGGAVGGLETYPAGYRVSNAIVSYAAYLWKMIWPTRLSVYYSRPAPIPVAHVVSASAVLLALTALALVTVRKRPYVAVGWFWYLITLIPVIGIVQVGLQSMADRFTYVPLIGIYTAIVWAVDDLLSARAPRPVRVALAVTVIAAAATTARRQLPIWKDSVALWTRATETVLGMDSYRAHMSLGEVLARQGRTAEARGHYTEAARLQPDSFDAHHKLGLLLADAGDYERAAREFRESVRVQPADATARSNLGLALWRAGQLGAASQELLEAVRLAPDLPEAHNNLGALLAEQGKDAEAIPHLAEAARLKPDFELAHVNLAVSLARTGRIEEAEREFRRTLEINPNNEIARRAVAELERGRKEGAPRPRTTD
jgi:protein O-mannosyl-transferase